MKEIKYFFSKERPNPLLKGRLQQYSENTLTRFLKIFFSRTTEPISTKLGTKHPWVKGIQVCSNERPHPFPSGDNYELAKLH